MPIALVRTSSRQQLLGGSRISSRSRDRELRQVSTRTTHIPRTARSFPLVTPPDLVVASFVQQSSQMVRLSSYQMVLRCLSSSARLVGGTFLMARLLFLYRVIRR
jgi:hypothetical protein